MWDYLSVWSWGELFSHIQIIKHGTEDGHGDHGPEDPDLGDHGPGDQCHGPRCHRDRGSYNQILYNFHREDSFRHTYLYNCCDY